jgi:Zn-finger nucleic acid-binding protein
MKCPACFNVLRQYQVGSIHVDVCHQGCGGIWFDAFELQQVDEVHETAGDLLLHVQGNAELVVDHGRKRACPKCEGVKLKRRFFSARREIEIDECPGCGGCWLDAGELAKIRAQNQAEREAQEAEQPYLTSTVIRYLYEMRIERRLRRE